MIPAIIIWICKKYFAPKTFTKFSSQNPVNPKSVAIALFLFCSLSSAFAQQSKFNIKRNGELIGEMYFQQKSEGENTYLTITSKVQTRFVFKINVETEDQAHFKNGRLLTSNVNRVVNGSTKEARKTSWVNNIYQLKTGDKISTLNQPISYNMMLLYTKEPVNISEIYSDNFQCFIPIQKNGAHQYRIKLPDGNYNDYHFENGICKLVVVNHSLYTIRMERV
ncbi:DUF6134 family protein [Pedobacter roseus]|uniref:DUF3108 domain-containing protein n=1 Tax=Pedobacter roseus TaxID=336820 RepID=A0A7G9QCR4_9SPHI|nr:DUF6134 family protein [Pedobacter roseus]QNN41139.1 hypothetical protein H9L23_18755 [Pedobacter roseus]